MVTSKVAFFLWSHLGSGKSGSSWGTTHSFPSSSCSTAWPNGIKPVPLPMDGKGMTPEGMDELLANWNPDEHEGMPRCVYVRSLTAVASSKAEPSAVGGLGCILR